MSKSLTAAAAIAAALIAAPLPAFAQDAIQAWVDGRLTAAEYQALGRARFTVADANRDSVVSVQEFVGLSVAEFDRADRNKDGKLTRGELRGMAPSGDTAAVSSGWTRQNSADLAAARFVQIDADRNGVASIDEYLGRLTTEFSRADLNKDGAMSRGELRGLASSGQ